MLISQYGKLLGKDRIVRVAGMLVNQLITVVGVETYNDLRNVTFEIYADRCGVVMIDATVLVRQFGSPVVPQIDAAEVEAMRSQKTPPLLPPSQGAMQGGYGVEDEIYDDTPKEGGIAEVRNPLHDPQGAKQRVQGTSQ